MLSQNLAGNVNRTMQMVCNVNCTVACNVGLIYIVLILHWSKLHRYEYITNTQASIYIQDRRTRYIYIPINHKVHPESCGNTALLSSR